MESIRIVAKLETVVATVAPYQESLPLGELDG